MYGEQVATPTLAYSFLKKSGLSSGGMILLFPPRLGLGLLGLPAINQAISPKMAILRLRHSLNKPLITSKDHS